MYTLDSVKGMLIGLSVGDALGAPFEFRFSLPLSDYHSILEYPPKFNSQFQGTRYMVIGQHTDDTEMSLTLARSILRNKGYNKNDATLSYMRWANSGNIGMGKNTRSLLKGVKTLRGYNNRYNKAMNGTLKGMKYDSLIEIQSNGSLMRCSPLALLKSDNWVQFIIDDINITNPNIVNHECGLIYITVIKRLLRKDDPQLVYEAARILPSVDKIIEAFSDIDNRVNRDVTKMKGWVVHAFYCAMLSLYYITNPVNTYQSIIDMIIKLGGDTDTNAAIAGALCGSYFGYIKLQEVDITRDSIEKVKNVNTSEGDFPRNPEYTLHDFDELTNNLTHIC